MASGTLPSAIGRRCRGDGADAGNLRRDGRHEHARRGSWARPPGRRRLLDSRESPGAGPGCPTVRRCPSPRAASGGMPRCCPARPGARSNNSRLEPFGRRRQLRCRHAEVGQLGSVETLRVVPQRGVAIGAHSRQDGAHVSHRRLRGQVGPGQVLRSVAAPRRSRTLSMAAKRNRPRDALLCPDLGASRQWPPTRFRDAAATGRMAPCQRTLPSCRRSLPRSIRSPGGWLRWRSSPTPAARTRSPPSCSASSERCKVPPAGCSALSGANRRSGEALLGVARCVTADLSPDTPTAPLRAPSGAGRAADPELRSMEPGGGNRFQQHTTRCVRLRHFF